MKLSQAIKGDVMDVNVIDVLGETPAIARFMHMFQFKAESDLYASVMLNAAKQGWGEDLGSELDGYVDSTVPVVENEELTTLFHAIRNAELESYIDENVGDFSLYGRLWDERQVEYVLDVPLLARTDKGEATWIELNLQVNADFQVYNARVAYFVDEISEETLMRRLNR